MSVVYKKSSNQEQGNALFLILIAVALFAALSYAITQSGRGGGKSTSETNTITAATITDYPATLRTAAMRMILTGTPGQGTGGISLLSASLTNTSTSELFGTAGGSSTLNAPPSGTGSTSWIYIDADTATGNGFYLIGVGTDTVQTGREVLAVLAGCGTNTTDGTGCTTSNANTLTLAQCQQINKGLGQASPYTPVFASVAAAVWNAATATVTLTGATNSFLPSSGGAQGFNCISNALNANGPFNYFHAIVEN